MTQRPRHPWQSSSSCVDSPPLLHPQSMLSAFQQVSACMHLIPHSLSPYPILFSLPIHSSSSSLPPSCPPTLGHGFLGLSCFFSLGPSLSNLSQNTTHPGHAFPHSNPKLRTRHPLPPLSPAPPGWQPHPCCPDDPHGAVRLPPFTSPSFFESLPPPAPSLHTRNPPSLASHSSSRPLSPPPPQVGRRTHAVLMTHMGRYTYSPTGALKWKKDVSEYAEALRSYGVPTVDEEMTSLEQVGWGEALGWGGGAELCRGTRVVQGAHGG